MLFGFDGSRRLGLPDRLRDPTTGRVLLRSTFIGSAACRVTRRGVAPRRRIPFRLRVVAAAAGRRSGCSS